MNKKPEHQSPDEWLADYLDATGSDNIQQSVCDNNDDNEHRDDDCLIESEPLIPEANYKMAYLEHGTVSAPGTGKLVIQLSILERAYKGTILKAFYRVRLKGPAGKFGKYAPSRQGEYYEQMCDLFPDLIEGRTDRISPQRLKGRTVLAEVITVKTKWNGQKRPTHTQYSKVNRLISLC
jgi:hypothetical protein